MNKINFTSASLILLLMAQCATVPLTGRKQFTMIPSSQILSLSNDSYAQVLKENKISTNTQYINTVKQVGTNITAAVEKYFSEQNQSSILNGYAWEYNVLVSKEMNAWCMPGGKIAFYEGIMPVCIDAHGVWKKCFFQTANKYYRKLKPFCSMYGHQLYYILVMFIII